MWNYEKVDTSKTPTLLYQITEDARLYYSMSPTTPNRLPDKSGVPRSFILNWQSSKAQGAKPLIRRPITACEACRSAKVKCNAKSDCQRCRNREIKCVYKSANGSSEPRLHSRLQRRSGSPWIMFLIRKLKILYMITILLLHFFMIEF